MPSKQKAPKKKIDLLSLTQSVVERATQFGITGYEFHHNGVDMTLTGLNKVMNGQTKKSNLHNLRQMEQYMQDNYENKGSSVKEDVAEYLKTPEEQKTIMQRLKMIEDKVDKSLLKQDIIFEIIKNAKSAELAYINEMVSEKLNSLQE